MDVLRHNLAHLGAASAEFRASQQVNAEHRSLGHPRRCRPDHRHRTVRRLDSRWSTSTGPKWSVAARRWEGPEPTIKALKVTSTHLSSAQLGITPPPSSPATRSSPPSARSCASRSGPGRRRTASARSGHHRRRPRDPVLDDPRRAGPKNFALAVPLATAKLVVPFQMGSPRVQPAIVVFNGTRTGSSGRWHRPEGGALGARSARSSAPVRRSATEGVLDRDDATLLDRTLTFSTHTAADVMTPRVNAVTLERDRHGRRRNRRRRRNRAHAIPGARAMTSTTSSASRTSRPPTASSSSSAAPRRSPS